MNQKEEIKNIMLQLQEYAKLPNSVITADEIEKSFRTYGIDQNEYGRPIDDLSFNQIKDILFRKINERKCDSNFSGYIDEGWNFFRTNYPRTGETPNFEWKVYIPITSAHYGFVVENVIAFLCDNGIVSSCKFSGNIRSDSMIVNLDNPDDVTKLNEYLDKQPLLKACLGNHQPFIPDWNGIGVVHGYDKETSYSERLSKYLAHFINECRKQNRYDLITAEIFLESMKNSLNSGMVQKPNEIFQIIEHMDIIMNKKNYIEFDTDKFESRHKL